MAVIGHSAAATSIKDECVGLPQSRPSRRPSKSAELGREPFAAEGGADPAKVLAGRSRRRKILQSSGTPTRLDPHSLAQPIGEMTTRFRINSR